MDKKELISKAAIDLFAINGFSKTTTPMIAKAAQISIGTVYNYFKNKEEIFDYIYQIEFAKRKAFLLSLEKSDISIVEMVRRFIEFHYTMMKDNPNTAKVIIQYSMLPSNQKLEHVQEALEYLPAKLTDMIRKAHQKGETSDIDPELVGPAIFYAVRGIAYTIQTSMGIPDYSQAMKELNKFIISALKN